MFKRKKNIILYLEQYLDWQNHRFKFKIYNMNQMFDEETHCIYI